MKIVFCSNYLNHHQLPLCEELQKLPEVSFCFVDDGLIGLGTVAHLHDGHAGAPVIHHFGGGLL